MPPIQAVEQDLPVGVLLGPKPVMQALTTGRHTLDCMTRPAIPYDLLSEDLVKERRLPKGWVAAVLAAFVLGGVVAIVLDRATQDTTGTLHATQTVAEAPVDTLQTVPRGPLRVVAVTVQFPVGYESTEIEGGPTSIFVDFGRVQVKTPETSTVYDAGAFFFLQPETQYTLTMLDDSQLSIVRLLQPGVQPTTQVR